MQRADAMNGTRRKGAGEAAAQRSTISCPGRTSMTPLTTPIGPDAALRCAGSKTGRAGVWAGHVHCCNRRSRCIHLDCPLTPGSLPQTKSCRRVTEYGIVTTTGINQLASFSARLVQREGNTPYEWPHTCGRGCRQAPGSTRMVLMLWREGVAWILMPILQPGVFPGGCRREGHARRGVPWISQG